MGMSRRQELKFFRTIASGFAALLLFFSGNVAAAPTDEADNLLVVLRGFPGANKQAEGLVAVGKVEATLPNGKQVELYPAWFQYIGDMYVRFVFDKPNSFENAETKDLTRLNLTPEQALTLAVSNIKKKYGSPTAVPWNDLMSVSGKLPDLDSSYFLDLEFWRSLLKQYPDGLVVAVPKRGGLLYAPIANASAVEGLRKGISYLYASSEKMQVSSALYLFKDDKWSVFQSAKKP